MRTNGQYLSGITSASTDGRPVVTFIKHNYMARYRGVNMWHLENYEVYIYM